MSNYLFHTEKYGGTGGTYMDNVIINEEIARISGSIGLSYGDHANLCVNQICRNASEEQKEKYLPKVGVVQDIIWGLSLAALLCDILRDLRFLHIFAKLKWINYSKNCQTDGKSQVVILLYQSSNEPSRPKYMIQWSCSDFKCLKTEISKIMT